MVKVVILLFLSLMAISCSNIIYKKNAPKSLIKRFPCYQPIDSLNEKSFYGLYSQRIEVLEISQSPEIIDIKYFNRNMIFFRDGMFITDFFDYNRNSRVNNTENTEAYVQELGIDRNALELFLNSSNWGLYMFIDDTIYVHYINHPQLLVPWGSSSECFIINNFMQIEKINECMLLSKTDPTFGLKAPNVNPYLYRPAVRINVKALPSSNAWLKREKWFWCDESEWRAYMEENGYKIRRRDHAKH
ncbi:MAG: hypothetical protein Q8J88_04805 [Bacteroidales bacterium]|nr:hypothetical protein [Bacteroidales bacterium]